MAFGFDDAVAGVGALGSFLGGRGAATKSKQLLGAQKNIANQQLGLFREASPYYGSLLQQYAQQAGLGQAPDEYGLSPQDELRLKAAQEDIDRYNQQQANQLRFQLGQQGIASGTIGAALARNALAGQQQYGQFRRQLAMNAPQERMQRLASLGAILGYGFGQAGPAASILGQQGALYNQQANQAFGSIGNILQQREYMQALKKYYDQQSQRQPYDYSQDLAGVPSGML